MDITGRFVLPGLIDVHVHYFEWMGELFLAHGVTTVKDVGNDIAWIASTRDEVECGRAHGPRIFFTGNGLDIPPPRRDHFIGIESDEMARRVVNILHEGGAMAIKVREMMPVEVLRPIVDEAHPLGLKVTGHLRAMRASDAAEAGIDGLEHASGIVQSTLDPWLRIDLDTLEATDIYAKYVAERKAYSLIHAARRGVDRRPGAPRRGVDPHHVRMVADGDANGSNSSGARTRARRRSVAGVRPRTGTVDLAHVAAVRHHRRRRPRPAPASATTSSAICCGGTASSAAVCSPDPTRTSRSLV